jgi:hypothetical protein
MVSIKCNQPLKSVVGYGTILKRSNDQVHPPTIECHVILS